MTFVRRNSADIDRKRLLRELAGRPMPSDEEINRHAVEDDSVWTEGRFVDAVAVYPPPTAEQVRALRARLGLSQSQFALKFGFTIDTVQQYEQGRRVPSGPASSLLRVIAAEPEAVMRARRRMIWVGWDALRHPTLPTHKPTTGKCLARRSAPKVECSFRRSHEVVSVTPPRSVDRRMPHIRAQLPP